MQQFSCYIELQITFYLCSCLQQNKSDFNVIILFVFTLRLFPFIVSHYTVTLNSLYVCKDVLGG